MDKTALDKKIELQATRRFEKELSELANYIASHPIGQHLTIKMYGKENQPKTGRLYNRDHWDTYGNLEKVRAESIEKYEAEELANLLNKLEDVKYLFENAGNF